MATHRVYLIPGFFGFSNLGDVHYFRAVRETLERNFRARGEELRIVGVRTLPTGSLVARAERVLDAVAQDRPDAGDVLHLVGHSTGGIDARLVASAARLPGDPARRRELASRIRTVACIASPHYGTPLANFFSTLYGKKLLYFVTLLVFVGLWRRPVATFAGLLGLGYRVYDLLGLNDDLLRQLTTQLLRDFTEEREREVRAFLDSVLGDVSLMVQLTPEAMAVVAAALEPLPGARVVSYGTVSPPPLVGMRRGRLRDLLAPIGTVLYGTLYTLTGQPEAGFSYAPLPPGGARRMDGSALPFVVDTGSNDGVVPSLSQVEGEFRGFVEADHLDVVGHYLRGPEERQDGADWFVSGARFDRERFERLWGDVAEVLLGRA